MADGIIQKTFKKYQLDAMFMREQARLINLLSMVEQELIEKIKQEVLMNKCIYLSKEKILRKLIGDNQE